MDTDEKIYAQTLKGVAVIRLELTWWAFLVIWVVCVVLRPFFHGFGRALADGLLSDLQRTIEEWKDRRRWKSKGKVIGRWTVNGK